MTNDRQQGRRWQNAMVLGLTLAGASVASAQPAPPPTSDPAALEASGQRHFDLAEYAAAVRDFKEAYRLTDQPGFLYNIAQAFRLGGDCRQALTFYKTFVRRVPDAPNLAKVKERISEMEACVAKLPPVSTGNGTGATGGAGGEPGAGSAGSAGTGGSAGGGDGASGGGAAGDGAAGTGGDGGLGTGAGAGAGASDGPADGGGVGTGDAAPGGGWMKWGGIGGLAAGGLAGVGAIYFATQGSSKAEALTEACATGCSSEIALGLEADGEAANRNAVIFAATSGVLVVGGAVLYVLSRRGQERPAMALVPTAGGAAAVLGGRF